MTFRQILNTFDIRLFPLDLGRFFCLPAIFIYRIKAYNTDGERTHKHIRGGAIVALNHTSFEDPFVSSAAFWYRRNFFLTAEVVMQGRIRSLLLRGMGCIKIDRSISDIEAMQKSIKRLRQKHLLTVFPQGGIMDTDDVSSVKSGIILLSLQSGAPIIPMYRAKQDKYFQKQVVVIGEPLDCTQSIGNKKIPSMHDIQELSKELATRMEACKQTYFSKIAHKEQER